MPKACSGPQLLEWDMNHFGVRIGRFVPNRDSDVRTAVAWAGDHQVSMLVARCAADTPLLHALELSGFLLMDTFVRYQFELSKKEVPDSATIVPVHPFREDDVDRIAGVAALSFKDYAGHFHNDPRLARERCDSLYTEWARNSCHERSLADVVLVADEASEIVGFATVKGLSQDTAEGILFGVAPRAQHRGVYRSLMVGAMRWCRERDFRRMEVDTQVNNYGVQRVWQRLGFEIFTCGHTFHLWL